MKNKFPIFIIGALVVLLASAQSVRAEIKLPSIISSNMVLQQGVEVPIWGWAAAGEKVEVSIAGQSKETIADESGNWMVKLDPLKSSQTPIEMIVRGKNTIKVSNILIGEAWICSGQSNMSWLVKNSSNSKEEIANANYPEIRLFQVGFSSQTDVQKNCKGRWVACSPKSIPNFSAVAYFFGRELYQKTNLPIGLIQTSYGGTPSEAWTSQKTFAANANFAPITKAYKTAVANLPEDALEKHRQKLVEWRKALKKSQEEGLKRPRRPRAPYGSKNHHHNPSGLYNGMIAPLIPFAIKGAIWYQGESNVGRAQQYREIFPAMIIDWRKNWNQGDFPFYFVQLANLKRRVAKPAESDWAELREAQRITLNKVPNTAMAVTLDIGEGGNIHPPNKQDVGKRLALQALANDYGERLVASGPFYESMSKDCNKIILKFKYTGTGMVTKDGGELKGFAIAGADRKFVWAKTKIKGDTITVWNDEIAKPLAVRYGWADNPRCNLYNKEGLPATPFRTDDWPSAAVLRIKDKLLSKTNKLESTVRQIIPTPPVTTDTQTMWDTEELYKVPKIFPCPEILKDQETSQIKGIQFEGESLNGKPTKVFAWYGLPEGASVDKPVPAMVLVHGGGGTAFKSWVELWLKRGFAAIAMSTSANLPIRNHKSPRKRKPWIINPEGGPKGNEQFSGTDKPNKDQWTYHAVAVVIKAHSLLRSMPEVDKNKVGLTGISWGGYLACIVSGVDKRFKFAAPVYGCGFYGENSGWRERLLKMGDNGVKWIELWDAARYTPFSKMPMLFCNGTNDHFFHMPAWLKTTRSVKGPRTLCLKVRMLHSHPPSGDPREITAFAKHILKSEAPLARIVKQGRNGQTVFAEFESQTPIVRARLCFTKSADPDLPKHKWESIRATIDKTNKRVNATLPEGTKAYYLNLVDNKNIIVSTEFEDL